jgi:environmental stress-induced protein Ves
MSPAAAHGRPTLLSVAERGTMPWKNGGGVTSEIAVHPAGAALGDFDWRISCAKVDRPGPFSRFPGVDRTIVILEGELELTVAGRPVLLSPESAPFDFSGDADSSGAPRAGSVRDLNVMTRRTRCTARVQRCLVEPRARFHFEAATTVVLASADMVVKSQHGTVPMAALDALRITGHLPCEFSSVVPGACFYRIGIEPRP